MWLDIQGVSGNKKTVESPSYFCFWDHEHYLCMAEKGEMFFYFFFFAFARTSWLLNHGGRTSFISLVILMAVELGQPL